MSDPTSTDPHHPGASDDVDWRPRAAALAASVESGLTVKDPAWLAAVRDTPRHVFVPCFYRPGKRRRWEQIDSGHAEWLDAVYQDAPLITALLPGADGKQAVVSSSSKPALMVRMLDSLDVADGHRILEIGTGTGYNAALMSHRLGAPNVFSIDIGTHLVDAARQRLETVGYAPTLIAGDGQQRIPGGVAYDRIIATCSVPAIPASWAGQLTPGGRLLADVKVGLHAGNLALLTRHPGRLSGPFLPKWAGFMGARHQDTAPPIAVTTSRDSAAVTATTTINPAPWSALVPWLLAQAGDVPITGYSRFGPDLETSVFTAADGAWAEIGAADPSGTRPVRQGGPRALWDAVETAHREWNEHRQPDWERLGLTVTDDGTHSVWLDEPSTILRRWGPKRT